MTRRSQAKNSNQTRASIAKIRPPDHRDIEETEYALWLVEQLKRVRENLLQRDVDDDLIVAVDYLISDQDRWISPEIENAIRLGNIRKGAIHDK